jgi:flagellar protein FliJ
MKGIVTLIKLSKRTLDDLRRKMVQLENQKNTMEQLAQSLLDELANEMLLSSKSVEMQRYFANFYRQIKIRQEKVAEEIGNLNRRIDLLREDIANAFAELKKYEIAQENEIKRLKQKAKHKETLEMDEIASQQHQRKTEA